MKARGDNDKDDEAAETDGPAQAPAPPPPPSPRATPRPTMKTASGAAAKKSAGSRTIRASRTRDKGDEEDQKETPKSRWGIYATAVALSLVLVGLVGGFFHIRNVRAQNELARINAEKLARPPKPVPTSTPDPEPRAPIKITLRHLGAEYQKNQKATIGKYQGKLLEVQGNFAELQQGLQLTLRDSVRDRNLLACILEKQNPEAKALVPGQTITVRGTYHPPFALHGAEIVKLVSGADERYRGKEIELIGSVHGFLPAQDGGREFPALTFERGRTDPIVTLECLFKKSDADLLRTSVKPGDTITVRALCHGRTYQVISLHNAQIIKPDTPRSTIPRLTVDRLLDEYEQDLRLPPASDEEPVVPVSVRDLVKAFAAPGSSAGFDNRVVLVNGVVEAREAGARALVFEGDTDQKLKVRCLFSPAHYRAVGASKALTVRGTCTGVAGGFVVLHNCEAESPENNEPRITERFFSVSAGRTLTYDSAWHNTVKNKSVTRQTMTFRDQGAIETHTIKMGVLRTPELLSGSDNVKWTKEVSLKGSSLRCRQTGDKIEIGQMIQNELYWEPILKLDTKAGDSWDWNGIPNQISTYVVVEFTDHRGRPAVIVRKTTKIKTPQGQPVPLQAESIHTYVKDIGEVTRATYETIPSKSIKRLVAEARLVEKEADAPPEKTPEKDKDR